MTLVRPAMIESAEASPVSGHFPVAPIAVGVVGLGRAGCWHLERFSLSEGFSAVAAWDDCADASGRAAGLAPRIAESFRSLLEDPQIELLVVATPPATHVSLAIEGLAAGKHVLLESPCGLNLLEAQVLLEAEQRFGRSVIVAHHRRWDPDFRLARDCLQSGQLGTPTHIKFVHWQYSLRAKAPVSANQSKRDFRDMDRLFVSDWRDQIATGGGTLWESGIHCLDQLLLLAGEAPKSVYARLDHTSSMSVDTGFLALIHFTSGLEAHIELNRRIAAPLETGWTIAGSRGSYASETRFTVTEEGEVIDVPLTLAPFEHDFHAAIAHHLRNDGPNPVPLVEAQRTIALIEAIRQSARTGLPTALESSA